MLIEKSGVLQLFHLF